MRLKTVHVLLACVIALNAVALTACTPGGNSPPPAATNAPPPPPPPPAPPPGGDNQHRSLP
jgi:hypothetical protein